ncbi:hypothetical protein V6Z12_A05G153600 [Gossypium hirsutum]
MFRNYLFSLSLISDCILLPGTDALVTSLTAPFFAWRLFLDNKKIKKITKSSSR